MAIRAYITFHPKDLRVLPAVVDGLWRHCGVSAVRVITKESLRPVLKHLAVEFMDENHIIEGVRHDTHTHWRWGWYFQQILKLGIAWVETDDYYLTVDADTVFLNPASFFNSSGRPLYTVGWEFHQPYFDVFERLLGFPAQRDHSFIVHHNVFNRHYVQEMCEAFRPKRPWWRNVLDYVEPCPPWNSRSQFAEPEMYGHYIKARHPEELNIRNLRWQNVRGYPTRGAIRRLQPNYDFCSFQHYLRDEYRLSRPWRVFLTRIKHGLLQMVANTRRP